MYLFACTVVAALALFHITQSLSEVRQVATDEGHPIPPSWRLSLAISSSALLMGAPLLASLHDFARFNAGLSVSMQDSGRTTVVMALVGGLAMLAIAALRIARHWPNMAFGFTGWAVMSLFAGGIAVVATLMQLTFSDQNRVTVNFDAFRDEVKDMQCEAPILLARWDRSAGMVTYRCPNGFVLNTFASEPFLPWPSYEEGQSSDLAAALASTMREAERNSH